MSTREAEIFASEAKVLASEGSKPWLCRCGARNLDRRAVCWRCNAPPPPMPDLFDDFFGEPQGSGVAS